jgi:hypothetical protein
MEVMTGLLSARRKAGGGGPQLPFDEASEQAQEPLPIG